METWWNIWSFQMGSDLMPFDFLFPPELLEQFNSIIHYTHTPGFDPKLKQKLKLTLKRFFFSISVFKCFFVCVFFSFPSYTKTKSQVSTTLTCDLAAELSTFPRGWQEYQGWYRENVWWWSHAFVFCDHPCRWSLMVEVKTPARFPIRLISSEQW